MLTKNFLDIKERDLSTSWHLLVLCCYKSVIIRFIGDTKSFGAHYNPCFKKIFLGGVGSLNKTRNVN